VAREKPSCHDQIAEDRASDLSWTARDWTQPEGFCVVATLSSELHPSVRGVMSSPRDLIRVPDKPHRLDGVCDRAQHSERSIALHLGEAMSLPTTVQHGYGIRADDGEALWLGSALGLIKAAAETTDGRFFAMEIRAPKGFFSPLHVHRDADELFILLAGDMRVQHGEDIFEAETGSLVYGPRQVPHSLYVDSDEAKMLLILSPSGMEGFFREVGAPADAVELPPPGLDLPDREALMEIGARFQQDVVGPPLSPKE
jgi:quercetin dioxygenase-like cupin family protein